MRRRPTRLAGLLILVAIVATGAVVALTLPRIGTQQIDQARATTLAREFFATAHGDGATVSNVHVLSVALGTSRTGRSAWDVNITGDVTEAGNSSGSPSYGSAMWLFVDAETGAVQVFAQG